MIDWKAKAERIESEPMDFDRETLASLCRAMAELVPQELPGPDEPEGGQVGG